MKYSTGFNQGAIDGYIPTIAVDKQRHATLCTPGRNSGPPNFVQGNINITHHSQNKQYGPVLDRRLIKHNNVVVLGTTNFVWYKQRDIHCINMPIDKCRKYLYIISCMKSHVTLYVKWDNITYAGGFVVPDYVSAQNGKVNKERS